jgi:hypothetical protein
MCGDADDVTIADIEKAFNDKANIENIFLDTVINFFYTKLENQTD